MISLDDTIFKLYKIKLDVIIVTYYPAPLEPVKLQYFHPWSCSLASLFHTHTHTEVKGLDRKTQEVHRVTGRVWS